MKTKKTFEIEIQRSNLTPAQFLSYVRRSVDRKGGEMLRGDLSLGYFKAGNDLNFDTEHDGMREKSISKPYEMQTYIKYEDGACYNEICEFEFDDEKTGHGYYYLVNVETVEETAEEIVEAVAHKVEQTKTHSAWERGVKEYAMEMLEEMAFNAKHGYLDMDAFSNRKTLREALLNGASDWSQYSWGGCALIYDGDIAERLCTPSELKKTHGGERKPNASEEWLDTQARALGQAAGLILDRSGVPSFRSWEVAQAARVGA